MHVSLSLEKLHGCSCSECLDEGRSGNMDLSLQLCPPIILLLKSSCMTYIEVTAFGKLAGILVL